MGAPPGVGSSTSAPTPSSGEKLDPPRPLPAGSASVHLIPESPPVRLVPETAPIQPVFGAPPGQPIPETVPSNPDEIRLRLAKGLRLFSDNHLDAARLTLQPVAQEKVAHAVLENIKESGTRFRSIQASLVLKSLGQDNAREKGYSEYDQDRLREAIGDIESQLISQPGATWSAAIEAAKKGFSAETLKAWDRFAGEQKIRIHELESLFQEKDRELLAFGLLNLAERYREQKLFGTSWTLAQLAAEFPETQERATALSQHLEGRRSSTEYVISDMFDQGGTSMAINLLSLFPAVAGARRISQATSLVSKPFLVRVPLTLMAGGGIHWASTKGLMWASGYDGQIMPRTWGEFGYEFASSTAQTGLALLLANRFWKVKPPVTKAAVAEAETVAAEAAPAANSTFRQRLLARFSRVKTSATETENVLANTEVKTRPTLSRRALSGVTLGGRALWWTTKTTLKLGTITAVDLGTQWGFHATGLKNMTPKGLPQTVVKNFFPSTYESRQTVLSTAQANRLFDLHQKTLGSAQYQASTGPIEANLNLDLFLTELDSTLEGDRREMAYAALAEASLQKKLGLNIRRWVLDKKRKGEFAGANKTLERQGLRLRFDTSGALCFTDSKQFPCP